MMRNIIRLFVVIWLCTLSPAVAHIKVQELTTPQGIKVWFVEDHTAPILSLSFSWQGGSAYDLASQKGATDLAMSLSTQGAGDLQAVTFSEKLQNLGVHLRLSANEDDMAGSLSTPIQHVEKAFELLKLSFEKPRFDHEEVVKTQQRASLNLANALKEPIYIVQRALTQTLFKNHPYSNAASLTPAEIAQLKRQDLMNILKSRANRETLVITACGSIEGQKLLTLIDQAFASFGQKNNLSSIPAHFWPTSPQAKPITIDTAHPQAFVTLMHPGIAENHPDYAKLSLLGRVLTGSLKARLPLELREKRGLVYHVYSGAENSKAASMWSISFATDSAKARQAIDVVKAELNQLKAQGLSQQELEEAQENLIGTMALNLLTSPSIAQTLHTFMHRGYPSDYLDLREKIIRSITLEDMNAFIRDFIKTEQLYVAAAGANITKELN